MLYTPGLLASCCTALQQRRSMILDDMPVLVTHRTADIFLK